MRQQRLLSQREGEVLALALTGLENKAIAYELGLAHSTIRVLMGRAASKLGASTRRELLAKVAPSTRRDRDDAGAHAVAYTRAHFQRAVLARQPDEHPVGDPPGLGVGGMDVQP